MSRWRLGFGGKRLCLDIFLRLLKVGRTVHVTILMRILKEMFVFRWVHRLSVYWVVYQNVLHFYITLFLIKCWSLWVVMHNFNFMFKSVRWICDALETGSRLLAIHSRLLLLFCDMLNIFDQLHIERFGLLGTIFRYKTSFFYLCFIPWVRY